MNWLFLRGLGHEKRHWGEFPNLLARTGEEVMALDLPGNGEQIHEKSPLSVAAHTNFLLERFFSGGHSNKKWCVVGLSFGGMIALDWLHRYPRDFSAAVIINSSSADLSPLIQRYSAYAVYRVLRSLAAKNPRSHQTELLKLESNLKSSNAQILTQRVQIAESAPVSYENLVRQLIAASRFIAPEKIQTPLLFLASLKDQLADVRCSKALADKYGATIKFHPTAGHDLTLDDPEWATQHIREFIETKI